MSDVHRSGDTTRPRLHLTAESGWINDPLGLTYRDDRYHLFFQYVPRQTEWRPNCQWGHATSDDLLHWTEHEVALAPGDGDDGCWSGSIVTPPQGPPALFYTTVTLDDAQIGRVRVAHPRAADWNAWEKGEVLAALPEGIDAVAYRDPFVFHDGDRWRMLMGAGLADGTATALVHSSRDLRTWTSDGELAGRHTGEPDPMWTGRVWECPQLFPLGDKWVLTVSVWEPLVLHYEAYAVGSYADGRFTPELGPPSRGGREHAGLHRPRRVVDAAERGIGAGGPRRTRGRGLRLVGLHGAAVPVCRSAGGDGHLGEPCHGIRTEGAGDHRVSGRGPTSSAADRPAVSVELPAGARLATTEGDEA